jgi:hypothetical protein
LVTPVGGLAVALIGGLAVALIGGLARVRRSWRRANGQ